MIQFSVCRLTAVRRKEKRFCEAAQESCCRGGRMHGRSRSAGLGLAARKPGVRSDVELLVWVGSRISAVPLMRWLQSSWVTAWGPLCSTEDGALAAASLQYPDLFDCFSVVLCLEQEVKKWTLLQTIHARVTLWSTEALAHAERPWCSRVPMVIVLCFDLVLAILM